MRHFIQYHNPERMGPYESDSSSFGIQTNKPVRSLLGNRIWLITSVPDRPRKYYLCETFIVDSIGKNPRGPRKKLALGRHGKVFDPMIRLDDAPWFRSFLRRHANFSLGLTEIDRGMSRKFLGRISSEAAAKSVGAKSGRETRPKQA